jgi:hypothetical protein
LLSQVADRCYLERCVHHLFPESVLGGGDRLHHADGREEVLYRNAFEFLRATADFIANVVHRRLDRDFDRMARHLSTYFGGADPYADAIRANLDRLARVVDDGHLGSLSSSPITTTRDLAPVYRAWPPRGGDASPAPPGGGARTR